MVRICCPVLLQCVLGSINTDKWSGGINAWITYKADSIDYPLSSTENRDTMTQKVHKLVKGLCCNLHILEIIAEGLVCLLIEPLFHFQKVRANMLVMFLSICNKHKLRRETTMRGEDGLMWYGCKDRKSSPHIFMTVNKTIMKCVY